MRAHFNRVLLDLAGNRIDEAQIRLRTPGAAELITQTIYSEATGGATRTNPWTITDGEIDFYLDSPARVQVGVTVGTDPEAFWDDVDVLAVASDSSHAGSGTGSTQVGTESAATGLGATALGSGAAATADQATALGGQSEAAGAGAIAVGSQATATQPGGIALGQSALAQGSQSVALGDGARAPFDQAAAIGAGAVVDRPGQVVLGVPGGTVFIPGLAVLRSPNGTPFMLAVTDEGGLYTQKLEPYEPPPPPDEGDGEAVA